VEAEAEAEEEEVVVVMASIMCNRGVMGRGVEEGGKVVVETGDMETGMTMKVVVGVVLCEKASRRIWYMRLRWGVR
jgi:hypothetical protein